MGHPRTVAFTSLVCKSHTCTCACTCVSFLSFFMCIYTFVCIILVDLHVLPFPWKLTYFTKQEHIHMYMYMWLCTYLQFETVGQKKACCVFVSANPCRCTILQLLPPTVWNSISLVYNVAC